ADVDAHDLCAARLECGRHAPGRRERDVVLARAAAGEDRDPAPQGVVGDCVVVAGVPVAAAVVVAVVVAAGVVVGVAGVVAVVPVSTGGAVTRWPTVIVTVEPCWSFPLEGDCARTIPSCVGSVTSCWIGVTEKPAFCSTWVAVLWSSPVTEGTFDSW